MRDRQTRWLMEGLITSGEGLCAEWPQGVGFLFEQLSLREGARGTFGRGESLGRQLEILNNAPGIGERVLLASLERAPVTQRLPRGLRRSPLGRAMAVLGPSTLKWVVADALLAPLMEGVASEHGGQIRRHCLNVAAESEVLTKGSHKDRALLFVASILHDAPQLLLLRHGQDAYGECLASEEGEGLSALERKSLGFDHGELGEALCTRLGLPQALISLLRDHHRVGERQAQMDPGSHLRRLGILEGAHYLGEGRGAAIPEPQPTYWAVKRPYSRGMTTLCSADPSLAL